MKLHIVAMHDRASGAFGRPQVYAALGLAIREFGDAVNDDKNGALYKHADDYDLFHIGDYDDNKGELTPIEPKQIAIGKQMKTGD